MCSRVHSPRRSCSGTRRPRSPLSPWPEVGHEVIVTNVLHAAHVAHFVVPRVPDDSVGKVVLLDAHFPPRHHVGDDVFRWRVGVDPVCPLSDGYHVSALLV